MQLSPVFGAGRGGACCVLSEAAGIAGPSIGARERAVVLLSGVAAGVCYHRRGTGLSVCACVGREDFDLIVVMLLERKQLLEMIGFVLHIVGSEVDGGLQCRVAAEVALGVS